MTIGDVIAFLETVAPPGLQELYDNSGLIVGNVDTKVNGLLISLDTTEAIIKEAISKGCNLIVSHHPIVFSGLKSITGKTYIERVVAMAIKKDIAIYAIHTNLDNVYHNGVNAKIASQLGLIDTRILKPKQAAEPYIGSGIIGGLPTPMPWSDFFPFLKKSMQVKVIRHTELHSNDVSIVALCGGSGSFLLEDAINNGADVFISADFKYHNFFDAENKIVIADIGHYESEQFTIDLLAEILKEKFSTFAPTKTQVVTNPIKYFI